MVGGSSPIPRLFERDDISAEHRLFSRYPISSVLGHCASCSRALEHSLVHQETCKCTARASEFVYQCFATVRGCTVPWYLRTTAVHDKLFRSSARRHPGKLTHSNPLTLNLHHALTCPVPSRTVTRQYEGASLIRRASFTYESATVPGKRSR